MSVRGDEATVASNARWTALWTSLIVLVLSLVLWVKFDTGEAGFQFVERDRRGCRNTASATRWAWTASRCCSCCCPPLLTPICILASWDAITRSVREYMLTFLILETMMVGMFCALDFVVFYIFFEGVLIPMFLIIGIWGGPRRVYSAFKFFLFTLTGSVLMLLALLAMWFQAGTTDIAVLLKTQFPVGDAELAVPRLLRLVRGEGADVAGAHLAARCACRGADRRLGHPGRRAAEDGRLRLPALLGADAAAGLGAFRAVDLHPVGRRGDLHLAGRAGAGGHEEADRLFLGRAYGRGDDRHLHLQRAGHPGRAVPDAVARHRLRRAVPCRRRGLRPHPHARDRALRRPGRSHAGLRADVHGVHHGRRSACPARPASSASSW